MSDYWEAYWLGGSVYDRRTRRTVEDLQQHQATERSQLARQMRDQQGDLQGQIDRLTEAFVALVEYEDTRGELNEHADAAAWRRYAREVVPTIVVTGGSGSGSLSQPPDVDDYWLSWAMRGLVASASDGPPGGGDGQLTRARQLDAGRTALLLTLVDALRRETRYGVGQLEAALPDSDQISRAHRAVWTSCADGRLGEAALLALEERLRTLLGAPDPAVVEVWVRGLAVLEGPGALGSSATLTVLRGLLDPDAGAERRSSGTTPAAIAAAPARAATGAAEDPLAEILRSLVDEGAPGEGDIRQRMAQVRARMGFVGGEDPAERRDEPAGALLDLLLIDLGSLKASPRRALAARLIGPFLPPLVATLRGEAAAGPEEQSVRVAGRSVVIAPDGSEPAGWREQLEQQVRAENTVSAALRPAGSAALGLGVLGLVLVLISPLFLILAVLGLGAGAFLLVRDRSARASTDAVVAQRRRSAESDVDRVRELQTAQYARWRLAEEETAASVARIEELLGVSATTAGWHAGDVGP